MAIYILNTYFLHHSCLRLHEECKGIMCRGFLRLFVLLFLNTAVDVRAIFVQVPGKL